MNDQLHGDFPRGGLLENASGPSSAFVGQDKIAQAPSLQFSQGNPEGRIFLGVVNARIEQERMSLDGRLERYAEGGTPTGVSHDRHMTTFAQTCGGNGRDVILPNLIHYPGSVIVIDPKGDLADLTADYRSSVLRKKVFVRDPFGAATQVPGNLSGQFNPMTILPPDSPTLVEDAGLIADALIVTSPSSKDPHLDESARQFLDGLILHVATSSTSEGKRNLKSVYKSVTKGI